VDAAAARAADVDLLQRHDVGLARGDHAGDALGRQQPVDAEAAMHVVGQDADHGSASGPKSSNGGRASPPGRTPPAQVPVPLIRSRCNTGAMASTYVGIGGWVYAPWRGVFYPDKLPQARELEYASRQVTAIEINGTFYGSQKPSSFRKWHDETPDG